MADKPCYRIKDKEKTQYFSDPPDHPDFNFQILYYNI